MIFSLLLAGTIASTALGFQDLTVEKITCSSSDPCEEVHPGDKITIKTTTSPTEDLKVILFLGGKAMPAPESLIKKDAKTVTFEIDEKTARTKAWGIHFASAAAKELSIGRTDADSKPFGGGKMLKFRVPDPPGVTGYSIRRWHAVNDEDKINCGDINVRDGNDKCWARLGDTIELTADEASVPTGEIVMWIDGRPMPGVIASRSGSSGGQAKLTFDWDRSLPSKEGSKESWMRILRDPREKLLVEVSAGTAAGPPLPTSVRSLPIRRSSQRAIYAWLVFFGATAIGLFILGKKSDLLREDRAKFDDLVEESVSKRRAYSLAKTQMAYWTFLVASALTYIWSVTWNEDVLNTKILVLMGISLATTLSANTVDNSKKDQAARDLAARPIGAAPVPVGGGGGGAAAAPAPVPVDTANAKRILMTPPNEWFLMDLISDSHGPSIARVQMVIFTLILGAIFIAETFTTLSMPQFSDTLLGLMGVSAAGYVSFKIPERKV